MDRGRGSRRPRRTSKTSSQLEQTTQEATNLRQALFEKFYRDGAPGFRPGNAYRSAIAAGYTPITAKANCHILARRCKVKAAEALQAMGCDGFSQAEKLLRLREARTVRWNPVKYNGKKQKRGGWDTFDDGDLQLRATQEINRVLDAYPAPKEADQRSPVQIIFPASFGAIAVQASAKTDAEAKADG